MKRISVSLLAGAASLLLPVAADAQSYPVVSYPQTYQALPVSGGTATTLTVNSGSTDDGGVTGVTLPFTFNYFGSSKSTIDIGTNGFVSFGSTFSSANGNQSMPNTSTPNDVIGVWWDDNLCPAGTMKTQTLGTAPNRQFVIEWGNCYRYNTSTSTFSAQLWLTEGSNVIRAHYGTIASGGTYNASMGIENGDGTVGLNAPGRNGTTCGTSCAAGDFPTNTVIQYGVPNEPEVSPTVSVGAMGPDGAGSVRATVSTLIRNIGATPATGVTWSIYVSNDGQLDTSTDTLIATHANAETIAAQGTATFADSVTFTRPANGAYFICVGIPQLNGEMIAANNASCIANPFYVGHDLMASITVPAVGSPGESVVVGLQLRNRGSDPTGEFQFRIYFSTDNQFGGDTLLYTGQASLQGADTLATSLEIPVPASINGKLHYGVVVIDSAAAVAEIYEDNNIGVSPTQIELSKPNLKPDDVEVVATNGCYFGEEISVQYDLCNNGSGNAWSFSNAVFLSDNFVITASDVEVSTDPQACPTGLDSECSDLGGGQPACYMGVCHAPCVTDAECGGGGLICAPDRGLPGRNSCQHHMAPTQCKTLTQTFTVPSVDRNGLPFAEGEYYVGVITDSTDRVNEENEGDNIKAFQVALNCRRPAPDFAAVSVVPPARLAAGETGSIYRVLSNVGNVESSGSYRYVLSTNETISNDDIPLKLQGTGGDGTVSIARAGESRMSDLVTVPSHVVPGEYYLGLMIDPAGTVRELDETNNTVIAAAKVRVEAAALRILTSSLPDGTVGGRYAQQLIAVGGTGDLLWSAASLPPGFHLSPEGLLTGVGQDEGVYVFEVSVTSQGARANALLALRVGAPMGSLAIATSTLPSAVVNQPYAAYVAATGGEPPYSCSFSNLPTGLVGSSSCDITGTAITATTGPQQFDVVVTDARKNSASAKLAITVVQALDLAITSDRFVEATAGQEYLGCVRASGGQGDYEWNIDPTTIPAGLSMYPNGTRVCLTGEPLVCGSFTVSVTVADEEGQSDDADLPMTVACERVGLETSSLEDLHRGDVVLVELETNAGDGARVRLIAGRLPEGLSLTEDGVLEGTVAKDATVGTYNFVVEVTNEVGGYGLSALTLTVLPDPLPKPEVPVEENGCSSAGNSPANALPFALVLLGLVATRMTGLRRVALAARRGGAAGIAFALTLLLAATGANAAPLPPSGGSVGGYVKSGPFPMAYQQLSSSATDLSIPNSAWGGYTNSGTGVIALPTDFSFRYFGQTFSHVFAGQHGVVWGTNTGTKSSSDYASPYNYQLPYQYYTKGGIHVWWDDWDRDSSYSPLQGGMFWEITGTAPRRVLKVEWRNIVHYDCYSPTYSQTYYNRCYEANHYSMQAWIYEASGSLDSTILFNYATPVRGDGQNIPGGISGYRSYDLTGSVGIEDLSDSAALDALGCAQNCSLANWPANEAVVISKKADLDVAAVTGQLVGWGGYAFNMAAEIRNIGPTNAPASTVQFFGSTDEVLSADDADLGTSSSSLPVAAGTSAIFTHTAPLPVSVAPGSYYIIAKADPAVAVDEDVLFNNVGVYGPFVVGEPTPDVIVESVSVPVSADVGSTFDFQWVARNLGNAMAVDVPYTVVISQNDVISSNDRRIYTGTFTVDMLTTADVTAPVEVPADLRAGAYHLGVIIDINNDLHEISDLNNIGASTETFVALGGPLSIITTTLPVAQIGAPYCVALEADGGDGSYTWSLGGGSVLPGGLDLVVDGETTLLCGTPSKLGTYDFQLEVSSMGETASANVSLEVGRSTMPLTVTTGELPTGGFGLAYEGVLSAVGGQPPYQWSLVEGDLPLGLQLFSNGEISGTPSMDGAFEVLVQVADALDVRAEQRITLRVASPARLTCVTTSLGKTKVGASLEADLIAAGGSKPYTWTTTESRRLSNGSLDAGAYFQSAPPPGLTLSGAGRITGAAAAGGRYLWTVEVTDATTLNKDKCVIALDVTYDQGLAILTSSLADAHTGTSYRAQLEAAGGEGFLKWELLEGSYLPQGLTLSEEGLIEGIMLPELLEGEPSKVFSFVVRVSDGQNRTGITSLSVRLVEPPAVPVEEKEPEETGCGSQAGSGAPSLVAVGLVLGLAAFRRKRS